MNQGDRTIRLVVERYFVRRVKAGLNLPARVDDGEVEVLFAERLSHGALPFIDGTGAGGNRWLRPAFIASAMTRCGSGEPVWLFACS